MTRIAITGVGLITPIGRTLDAVSEALRGDASGVRIQREWAKIGHLATRLAGERRLVLAEAGVLRQALAHLLVDLRHVI